MHEHVFEDRKVINTKCYPSTKSFFILVSVKSSGKKMLHKKIWRKDTLTIFLGGEREREAD